MSNSAQMETPRLWLRPVTPGDLDALHEMWTEPHMRRYLWDDEIIPRETAAAVIESSRTGFASRGFGFWGVARKAAPTLIGFCGLRPFTTDDDPAPLVEILFGIDHSCWNQGLAVEAARAVLHFGFTRRGLECIHAGADPPNGASLRVMEKLGMSFAKRTAMHGREAVYYALSRPNWPPPSDGEVIFLSRRPRKRISKT